MSARSRDWAPNPLSPEDPAIFQPISYSPDCPHLAKPLSPLVIAMLNNPLRLEGAAVSERGPPHQSQRSL